MRFDSNHFGDGTIGKTGISMNNSTKKRLFTAAILAVFALVFAVVCGSEITGQNTSLPPNSGLSIISIESRTDALYYDMYQQNTADVKPGTWGGRGMSLLVEKNSATIELDCARGTISSRLRTSKGGKFAATGSLTRSGPGPIRLDDLPKPQNVRFEGKVTGKQMRLKITLADSGDVMGTYILQRDTQGSLVRCM